MTSKQISLLAAFREAGVEFVVVGGLAVIFYGYERYTRDMDIFLRPTEENAKRAFSVLQAKGVEQGSLRPDDLLLEYETTRLGKDDDSIDVLNSFGKASFDDVWADRVEVEIGGAVIPFVSRDRLIANKLEVGRLRDLVDVEELELVEKYRKQQGES